MSYCGNCGRELEDGAKFCGVCGTAVHDATTEEATNESTDSKSTQRSKAKKKRRKKKSDWNLKKTINFKFLQNLKPKFSALCSKISGIGAKWDSRTDAQKNRWLIAGGFMLICLTIIVVSSNSTGPEPQPQPNPIIVHDPYVQPQPNPQPKPQPKNDPLVTCPGCNGAGGWSQGFYVQKCSICQGNRLVPKSEADKFHQTLDPIIDAYGLNGGGGGGGGGRRGGGSSDEKDCWNCHGSGKCSSCAGRGEYHYSGSYGQKGGTMDCSTCHGTGKCQVCYGRGKR